MERPDAVLFDLDGTIIDSEVPFAYSINHTLAAYGQPPREMAELRRYLGPPTHEAFTELLGPDEELVHDAVQTYRTHYREHSGATTTVYDGIPELLRKLHGQVPLAVATSKIQVSALSLLEGLGLADLFDTIAGPAMDAVNESKATTIAHALEGLGGASNFRSVVMIGDRFYDVVGAREHGIPTIGVLWGAGSEQELREAGADWLAAKPDEIPPILGL
jgi:phosphoglycolate phosphatase